MSQESNFYQLVPDFYQLVPDSVTVNTDDKFRLGSGRISAFL